jgi:hypothetical protein
MIKYRYEGYAGDQIKEVYENADRKDRRPAGSDAVC